MAREGPRRPRTAHDATEMVSKPDEVAFERARCVDQFVALRTHIAANMTLDEIHRAI
jgi:hypothetical protein